MHESSEQSDSEQVEFMCNGKQKPPLRYNLRHLSTLRDLRPSLEEHFRETFRHLRVFNSLGVEYDENDFKYVKPNEIFYASGGEDFDALSCLNEYDLGELLGKGGFGEVYKACHKRSGEEVAIKFISSERLKRSNSIDMFFKEAEVMRSLRHPHVINIKRCFALRDMRFFIVMELMKGGELGGFLKARRLSQDEARIIFLQIVKAVSYCHSKNLIHKDLKPENILLVQPGDPKRVKVADFGIASPVAAKSGDAQSGTLRYMPPQIISGREKGIKPSADVWAIGCILYLMAFGQHPFPQTNRPDLCAAITNPKVQFPKDVSQELTHLLKGLLHPNPEDRMTLFDVRVAPWFNNEKIERPLPENDLQQHSAVSITPFKAKDRQIRLSTLRGRSGKRSFRVETLMSKVKEAHSKFSKRQFVQLKIPEFQIRRRESTRQT